MKQRISISLTIGLFAAAYFANPTQSPAGLVSVTQAAFSGSETVVDFNAPFIDEALLTNEYSGLGVTFTGSLHTMQNPGDTSLFPANGGGQIASNWVYGDTPELQGTVIDVFFDSAVNRVGFWRSMWAVDTLMVTAFSGAVEVGSVAFAGHDTLVQFTGVEDVSTSFNRIQLEISGPENNFLAIDDLRFEAASVPEPASLALYGSGLGIIGTFASRRRSSRSKEPRAKHAGLLTSFGMRFHSVNHRLRRNTV